MNMSLFRKRVSSLAALAALLLAILILVFPQIAFRSLLQGFEIAFCRVVPAVLPMMIVSGVIIDSPLASWLGLLLQPYTRLLGIKERSASTVLFLGLLGGFAILAQGIDQLYRSRRVDRHQAELLLCAGLNAGPSFILLSVGYGMFGSVGLGILFLASLYLGNLSAALLLHIFRIQKGTDFPGATPAALHNGFPRSGSFESSMQKAVSSCATLCGYIAFFCLLCSLAQQILPAVSAGTLCVLLEVTNGALFSSGLSGAPRIWLTICTLCWAGLSIQMQAKALLPAELSLRRFYLSRLLATPLSLMFYGIGIRIFPQALPAIAGHNVQASRFSFGIWISFLLMVAAFLYECTPKASLLQRKKIL